MDSSLNRSFKLFPEGSIFRSQQAAASQGNFDYYDIENVAPAAAETPSAAKKAKIQVKRINSVSRKLFNNPSKPTKRFLPPFKSQESKSNENNERSRESIVIPNPPSQKLSQLFGSCTVTQRTPLVTVVQNSKDTETEVPIHSEQNNNLNAEKELNEDQFPEIHNNELQATLIQTKKKVDKLKVKKTVRQQRNQLQDVDESNKSGIINDERPEIKESKNNYVKNKNGKNKNGKNRTPLFNKKEESVSKSIPDETLPKINDYLQRELYDNDNHFKAGNYYDFEAPAPIKSAKVHEISINIPVALPQKSINDEHFLMYEANSLLEGDKSILAENSSLMDINRGKVNHTMHTSRSSFSDSSFTNNAVKNNLLAKRPNIKIPETLFELPVNLNTSDDLDKYTNLSHVDNPLVWETPKRKVSTSLLNIFDRTNQVCSSPVLFNDQHNTSLPARLQHEHDLFNGRHFLNDDLSKTIADPTEYDPCGTHMINGTAPQKSLRNDNFQNEIPARNRNPTGQNEPNPFQISNAMSPQNPQNRDASNDTALIEDHCPPMTPPNFSEPTPIPKWNFTQKPKTDNILHFPEIKEEVVSPVIFTASQRQHPQFSADSPVTPNSRSNFNDLKNVMFIWASHSHLISDLQHQSSEISVDENEILPVYQFAVSIDVQHLIDFHEELGSMVLKIPLTFTHILKLVCFDVLRSEGMVIKLYSEFQLIIKPLLTNIPSLFENTITSPEDIRYVKQNPSGLYQIQGMVIGLSSLTPYTKCAKYTCAQTDCQWARENCYVISANVSTLDCDLIRYDFPCKGCGNMLQEDIGWRKMSEKRYCFVTPKKAATENLQVMHSSNSNIRCESIRIIVKDDFKDAVNIGSFYWFTGVFKHSITPASMGKQNVRVTFEVLSVAEDIPYTNPIKNYQRVLPDSLCSLYQDRQNSPWSFVSSLAYCFLETISPPGTYYLFKTCLLLSLLMEGDRSVLNLKETERKYEVNNIHILVHNEDILPYQHMMLYACKFSESPVIHRVPMDLFGTITQDDKFTYVDGGSLALSSTSVCIIPNMLELKKKQMIRLQNVFDNEVITVHIPKNQHDEVQQNQFCIPFKGFVWTCNELQKGNINTDFAIEDVSKMPPGLSSLFNLIFHEPTNSYNIDIDVSVCDHILSKSLDVPVPTTSMFIHEHFDEYLTHARKQEVQMSQEAFKLIKTFYLVSRRVNTSIAQISQTSFQTLLCLSAAHAKAMLHGIVMVNDAVAAIYLFEQLMALFHGESTFGVLPVIHFLNSDISKHLGPENDERMFHLKRSVINYCATYYPDVSDLLNAAE